MKIFRLLMVCCFAIGLASAAEKTPLRIGAQATGTLAWELTLLKTWPDADFTLDVTTLANPEAGKVALQSGAVDVIVGDWLWVSKMRASGVDLSFYPYSTATGALLVSANSPIHSIKDLPGKRLGLAGGELDKNWLLLQAVARQQHLDLQSTVEKVMAAPPLLSEQLKQGRLDAVLTYWPFAVRLKAEGYRQILDGQSLLTDLGIHEPIPALGFVFKQSWAEAHKTVFKQFLAASASAKQRLCLNAADWESVLPLTQTIGTAAQAALRQQYCQSQVSAWGEAERLAAARVYALLGTLAGDSPNSGAATTLSPGTFWQP